MGEGHFHEQKVIVNREQRNSPESMVELEDRLKRAKIVTLEIGTGGYPYFMETNGDKLSSGEKVLQPGELYITVDKSRTDWATCRRKAKCIEENLLCMQGNAQDMTNLFKGGVVDTVLMHNVFGEIDETKIFIEILKEIYRILKNRGKLVVIEDITPKSVERFIEINNPSEFQAFLRQYISPHFRVIYTHERESLNNLSLQEYPQGIILIKNE